MARYALIDQLRKSERAVPLGAAVQAIATVDPGDVRPLGSLSDAAVRRLQSAVAALPPAERALVHQRFWAGMSVADIARGLGEPYSRVAVRMFRLIRKLRRALESS